MDKFTVGLGLGLAISNSIPFRAILFIIGLLIILGGFFAPEGYRLKEGVKKK